MAAMILYNVVIKEGSVPKLLEILLIVFTGGLCRAVLINELHTDLFGFSLHHKPCMHHRRPSVGDLEPSKINIEIT